MSTLRTELKRLEGILQQNPETGALKEKDSYLDQYTNRVFGAPFQFMDDVDKRFSDVNDFLGNEYLRNIMLNSPILHIRPGMPHYTGGDDSTAGRLLDHIKSIYISAQSENMSAVEGLLEELASSTIFGKGSKLQRRMFGFRETYYDYMQHANYMCRSVAVFLNLTSSDKFPSGTYIGSGDHFEEFSNFKWENYRMLKDSTVKTPWEYFQELVGDVTPILGIIDAAKGSLSRTAAFLTNGLIGSMDDAVGGGSFLSNVAESFKNTWDGTLAGSIQNKIQDVQFMVEPGSWTEELRNETTESKISSAINGIGDEIGSEIGFITNSNADTGVLGEVTSFLGDAAETVGTSLAGLVEGVTGGFMTNLFGGAIASIKGQKMIYPKIYKNSESQMNYTFKINLRSPYGDVYNYYMNIVVPLLHLIALASPRLVTANTAASPYVVQLYIPGQCTCHLGIISQLTVTKNPNSKNVSVNGFPLEVTVELNVEELYNAMTISPANDPASFLFNETLNDYMSNMAGLIPSVDTYTKQRKAMFENLANYMSGEAIMSDIVSGLVEEIEDFVNPFVGR